jgi:hypothetical protein
MLGTPSLQHKLSAPSLPSSRGSLFDSGFVDCPEA